MLLMLGWDDGDVIATILPFSAVNCVYYRIVQE